MRFPARPRRNGALRAIWAALMATHSLGRASWDPCCPYTDIQASERLIDGVFRYDGVP
jgi:hypothetical protein